MNFGPMKDSILISRFIKINALGAYCHFDSNNKSCKINLCSMGATCLKKYI